jgi:hypothetical protein
MRTALFTTICLCLAFGQAAGETLYGVRVDDATAIIAVADRGATVRHIGSDGVIVQGDDALGDAFDREGLQYRRLGSPEGWEALYLCYPSSRATTYVDLADVLWTYGRGAVLVGARRSVETALFSRSFMVVELPESIDVRAWFDDRPPDHIRKRTAVDELKVRGLVADVINAISPDSLMAHATRLSEYPDGSLRTRFVARDECLTEAKPYIIDALTSYLPPGSPIGVQRFPHTFYACNDSTGYPLVDYPLDNVFGVLKGNGDLGGSYIICAHYDAIASRSFPGEALWFCDNPAPGADDNATGVAAVLEAARVLSDTTYKFPFDLRFVLFSGEERGLLGSEVYADSAATVGDTIYGVLNIDMIGYKRAPDHRDTCHIVSNLGSWWLGEWIVDTAQGEYHEHFETLDTDLVHYPEMISDHGEFWLQGYDAVLAIEHWDPRDRNPNYHMIQDTVGHLYAPQFTSAARLVAASVARLIDPDEKVNLAIGENDVALGSGGFWIGSSTTVDVDVHVFGPLEPVSMLLEAWDGEPGVGELLSSFSLDREMGGGEVIHHAFEWEFDQDDLGGNTLTLVVSTEDTDELTLADNTLTVPIRVSDPNRFFVMSHFVYPNPVPTMDDLNFRFELSREASLARITVYDVLGEERFKIERYVSISGGGDQGLGTSAGWNTMSWRDADRVLPDLPSGVYIYELEVFAGTGAADRKTGKFAVAR